MSKPGGSRGGAHSHGKAGRPKPSLNALSGFATAKASTYDKQARKRKERALNSKVVNKYRKLKARLQASGGTVPHLEAALHTGSEQSEDRQLLLPGQQETARPPQHQQQQQQQQTQTADSKSADKRPKHGRKPKPASQLQRIAQEKEAEREEQRRQKEEQRLAAEKRREEVAQARQRRKQQTTQFRKRTRTGQPVMKFRIGKVLAQLQAGKA